MAQPPTQREVEEAASRFLLSPQSMPQYAGDDALLNAFFLAPPTTATAATAAAAADAGQAGDATAAASSARDEFANALFAVLGQQFDAQQRQQQLDVQQPPEPLRQPPPQAPSHGPAQPRGRPPLPVPEQQQMYLQQLQLQQQLLQQAQPRHVEYEAPQRAQVPPQAQERGVRPMDAAAVPGATLAQGGALASGAEDALMHSTTLVRAHASARVRASYEARPHGLVPAGRLVHVDAAAVARGTAAPIVDAH